MRLSRRLRNEREPDNPLSVAALSALGVLFREGECTIGALAAHERVQPPSMTRTVNCLVEDGYAVRRPHETDGRQVLVDLTEQGPRDPARRPSPPRRLAGPAPARAHPRRTRPPPGGRPPDPEIGHLTPKKRSCAPTRGPRLSPTFRALHNHNYRLYATGGIVSNTGTWMQRVAQDWLVVLLATNDGTALGITTGLQFLPALLLSPYAGLIADRVPKLRLLQITQSVMARDRAAARRARRHRNGRGLARLRPGLRLRRRVGVRRPGSPELRQRDGRPRRPEQRRRPQLRVLQRRAHGGTGDRRPADRRLRRRRDRDRLGDRAQRPQLRRRAAGAACDGRPPTCTSARARSATRA